MPLFLPIFKLAGTFFMGLRILLEETCMVVISLVFTNERRNNPISTMVLKTNSSYLFFVKYLPPRMQHSLRKAWIYEQNEGHKNSHFRVWDVVWWKNACWACMRFCVPFLTSKQLISWNMDFNERRKTWNNNQKIVHTCKFVIHVLKIKDSCKRKQD